MLKVIEATHEGNLYALSINSINSMFDVTLILTGSELHRTRSACIRMSFKTNGAIVGDTI